MLFHANRDDHIIVSQKSGQFRRRFVRNVSQHCIRPRIGTVEYHKLIAGVKDNISRLCRDSLVISRQTVTDGTDLLEPPRIGTSES